MKNIIILVLITLMCSQYISSQSLEDTIDFLEYAVDSNPPFDNFETKLKVFNSKDEVGNERFVYVLKMLDDSNSLLNSKISTIYIKEIKNIILEESMYESQRKYSLRLGLKTDKESKSFTVVYNGETHTSKVNELIILLPYNNNIVVKVKKAIMHLGKLNGIKVKDLDMF